jgi:chemotaxis protein methyltransferase CheR
VPGHFALGNLAQRQGDARSAKRCFDNALELLAARRDDEVVPESDGLTAGRLREIILATAKVGEQQ